MVYPKPEEPVEEPKPEPLKCIFCTSALGRKGDPPAHWAFNLATRTDGKAHNDCYYHYYGVNAPSPVRKVRGRWRALFNPKGRERVLRYEFAKPRPPKWAKR